MINLHEIKDLKRLQDMATDFRRIILEQRNYIQALEKAVESSRDLIAELKETEGAYKDLCEMVKETPLGKRLDLEDSLAENVGRL